jgi:lipoprotein LprG
MHYLRVRSLFALVVILLLAACDMAGQPSATPTLAIPPTPTPAPTPTPTPAQLSAQISQAMLAVQSFHFAIGTSGKPIPTDETGAFTILNIEGDLRRPADVLATVKVRGAGSLIDIHTIALAGKQYLTNPITRQWQCAPVGSLFNPAVLFDPSNGIEHLLQSEFKDVTLVGTEDVDGQPNLHLRGTLAGPPLMIISANSIGHGTVQGDLWADAATLRITKIMLVDPATDAANPTALTLTFSGYDKAVDVREPPGAQC